MAESILWNFGNGTDGAFPYAGLVIDGEGNLYGTTGVGGIYTLDHVGAGIVFKLTPPANGSGPWTESILWNFGNGTDGAVPAAALVIDGKGNFYGTTDFGGVFLGGTAFELSAPAAGDTDWTETMLWDFGNGTDGVTPEAGLLLDQKGRLYGTTLNGGIYDRDEGGGGTVFELTPPALEEGNWTESLLADFGHNGNGNGPESGLIMDPAHNLYGTTSFGGTQGGNGTVFRISNLGNPIPTP